eukprot:scaffold1387_cov382-Prasinococcus_capsulatus_cf.AAC.1
MRHGGLPRRPLTPRQPLRMRLRPHLTALLLMLLALLAAAGAATFRARARASLRKVAAQLHSSAKIGSNELASVRGLSASPSWREGPGSPRAAFQTGARAANGPPAGPLAEPEKGPIGGRIGARWGLPGPPRRPLGERRAGRECIHYV